LGDGIMFVDPIILRHVIQLMNISEKYKDEIKKCMMEIRKYLDPKVKEIIERLSKDKKVSKYSGEVMNFALICTLISYVISSIYTTYVKGMIDDKALIDLIEAWKMVIYQLYSEAGIALTEKIKSTKGNIGYV